MKRTNNPEYRIFERPCSLIAGLAAAIGAFGGCAQAQSISLTVDSSYADYLLEMVCSNAEIDEARLRSWPVVQRQVKHHSNLSSRRDFDAFVEGLAAAAKCETLEDDVYQFAPLVENKEEFVAIVAFFKSRSEEIEQFVVDSVAPYVPEHLDYSGDLVLSIVGNSCGGFSMDGAFYLALACLVESPGHEFETAKVISAHETYHALQYAFFHPFEEDIARVRTLDDAFDYHFMNLLLEGTAEYVADSRQIEGSGVLTDIIKRFASNGYRRMPFHMRLFSYSAELLKGEGDALMRRLKDVYQLGYAGDNRQVFYFVGANMAGHIERVFGRRALVCVLALPPEQFVRAYDAAAARAPGEETPPLGEAMAEAAGRLNSGRHGAARFESCIS